MIMILKIKKEVCHMFFNNKCHHDKIRQHVHPAEGFVHLAGPRWCIHKHCFNGVTGIAIPCGDSHVHDVNITTDIVDCHCHRLCGRTGPAIPTGDGNHIHIIEGYTTFNDGHKHCVKVATGIEEPICYD